MTTFARENIIYTKKTPMRALSPLIFFLILYLATSIILQDFYKVPIAVAFMLSAIVALLMARGSFSERVSVFTKGVGSSTLQLMVFIFILAGAFAASAKAVGAVDSTVNLTLSLLPGFCILPGIFLASCFISFSMGTSCGTIAALTPVAVGIAQTAGFDLPLMVGLVVGGTYFGDNLSFISDTTIIATQTQGCRMRDKFRTNLRLVLPVAILLSIVYLFIGMGTEAHTEAGEYSMLKVMPYILIIATALTGMNVILVLLSGLLFTGIIGMADHSLTFFAWMGAMNEGLMSVAELVFCTLLAGGMLEMIRHEGGIDLIISRITRHINSTRGAEFSIALMVTLVNICTANNTVSIITAGPIARDIAQRFDIAPRRSASILDTMSCFAQGILPYGAQVLIAAALSTLSPIDIVSHLYYPILLGIAVIISIVFYKSRK